MQAEPSGWGDDALTDYLKAYRMNQFATFANKGALMDDLLHVDALYARFLNGAINPRPYYPINFMLRAHSSYRAAVSAVMGGQLYEAQALLRLCLEHAAYGFFVGGDVARMERWLRRGDSDETRKALRKEFHNDMIRAHISARAPKLSELFDEFYAQLIEFGAHPNEQGYSLNSTITRGENGDVHFNAVYLQGNCPQLDLALKAAAQVGLWPLQLMQLLYRERYELLGIREALEKLHIRL